MFKINSLYAAAILAVAPFALAEELSSTGEFIDGVAAVVDDGVVLKSQLTDQIALITQRAETENISLPPPAELREQLLERLILTEVQLQRASRMGLRISDQMVNESIGRIADQNGVKFEDMPAILAADGIDYAKFRRDLREEITLDQLRRADVGNTLVEVLAQKGLDDLAGFEDQLLFFDNSTCLRCGSRAKSWRGAARSSTRQRAAWARSGGR